MNKVSKRLLEFKSDNIINSKSMKIIVKEILPGYT